MPGVLALAVLRVVDSAGLRSHDLQPPFVDLHLQSLLVHFLSFSFLLGGCASSTTASETTSKRKADGYRGGERQLKCCRWRERRANLYAAVDSPSAAAAAVSADYVLRRRSPVR